MNPLVSILIPVFNRNELIVETVNSALNQTYSNIEVIVVDNCSTDNTWQTLKELSRLDERVRIFQNIENIGPVKNWKACVDRATGEYSKILWSDDLMHSDFIAASVDYMKDPSVAFVYSAAKIFTTTPENSDSVLYQRLDDGKFPSELYIKESLLSDNVPYSPGCAIFRTKDLREHFVLNIENQINSDFSQHAIGPDLLLFLNIAEQYKYVAHIVEPMSYFRSHLGSISVESASLKLMTMYNIAKAYFLEKSIVASGFNNEFNSALLIFYIKNKKMLDPIGIKGVSYFYPNPKNIRYDYVYFFKKLFSYILGKFQ